jgi:molybdate transport system permease protein
MPALPTIELALARESTGTLSPEMDHAALRLSLQLAALTTVALLAIGLPIAGWLTHSRWRWKFLVFYLLFGLGPNTAAGRLFASVFGHPFPFSFTGLLVASILYSLPFAVQPFAAAIAAVDARLLEASYTLGVSRLETFFRVTVPLAWNGILAGAVLAFAHTLGEFGVVLMVGGNIEGETRTLSIAIFDHVEALEYAAANRTAALLLAISFSVLVVVYALQRRPFLR